ncbi:NAD(P)-dependent oxidoreductase [Carnobacterium gallinarum]|uniref:NAD(P)-dependent oxidoreductase n=1 Tax=Carnobacterium gallinarum TaxID=2749 RepID=UPI00054EF800|nr:NAD(P)-dependent oxidoreductase [Carnobacterium gallinarum]
MKIGIIGASGKSGNFILKEAVSRGHEVTAIVRNAAKITDTKVTVLERDILELSYDDVKELDILVDAFNAPDGEEEMHQTTLAHLTDLLKGHKAPRLMVVGGAGSLYVDPEQTVRLMDTPGFPDAYKPTSNSMGIALNTLKTVSDVTWTYLSPSAMFLPDAERTGSYTAGEENLLVNGAGESEISYADYAIALIDEAEQGKHINQRFTVVSK